MPELGVGGAIVLSSLIGAGSSIAGSALSGSKSATTPTLSPELQALQNQLAAYSSSLMSNPAKNLAPIKLAATDQINRNYTNMPNTVANTLSGMGYGASGKLGTAVYNTAAAREGDLTNLEGQYGQMAVNQANEGASLSEQLLSSMRGVSSTSSGNPLGNALMSGGNGMSNLSTLLMLQKALGGGGGVATMDSPGMSSADISALMSANGGSTAGAAPPVGTSPGTSDYNSGVTYDYGNPFDYEGGGY